MNTSIRWSSVADTMLFNLVGLTIFYSVLLVTPANGRDNLPMAGNSCVCTCYVPASESPDGRVHRQPDGANFHTQGECSAASDVRMCSVSINGQSVPGRVDGSDCKQIPDKSRSTSKPPAQGRSQPVPPTGR